MRFVGYRLPGNDLWFSRNTQNKIDSGHETHNLRSTMSQKRLTYLLLLYLDQSILNEISLENILKEFSNRTATNLTKRYIWTNFDYLTKFIL